MEYKQTFLDEFDYKISNLAVDMRDGVRLAKIMDVLKNDPQLNLLKKVRVPANSRLQKVYNLQLTFKELEVFFILQYLINRMKMYY